MDNEEMQISEVDKKMLKKAINFEDKGDFAMYEEVSEIKDHLEGIHENLKIMAEKPEMEMPMHPDVQKMEVMGAEVITIKGIQGDSPTDEHLVELITPLIPEPIKGDDGKTPTTQELIKIIQPLIPEPEKGDDGNTPTEEELKKLITPLIPQPLQGSPDTSNQIVDKLNQLEEVVDISVIKGLKKEVEDLKQMIKNKPTGNMGFKKFSIIKRVNLTSQCNGVLKSFALPKDTTDVLGVWGTSFPISFDTADFTLSGNTLTLSDSINPPDTGQTLFCLIETLFY